jgi:hypothetical protein
MVPPPLPGHAGRGTDADRTLRTARLFNFFLPGAGLILLGRRVAGSVLAGAFLICFAGVLGVFLHGYARYLQIALSENLLEGNKLEEAGAAFHQGWTFGFAGAGLVLYLISAWLFAKAKRLWSAGDHRTGANA